MYQETQFDRSVGASPSDSDKAGLFDSDRWWLRNQPELKSWDEGSHQLRERMLNWLKDIIGVVTGETGMCDESCQQLYLQRIWACWRFHWRAAAVPTFKDHGDQAPVKSVSGEAIGRRLRGLEAEGGRLDLITEVAQVEAAIQGQGKALRDLLGFLEANAKKVIRRENWDGIDDWTQEFVMPRKGKPPEVSSFIGRGSLARFIQLAAKRADIKRTKTESTKRSFAIFDDQSESDSVDIPTDPGAEQCLIQSQCEKLFRRLIRQAMQKLSQKQRIIVIFRDYESLQNQTIARILGMTAGNCSRQYDAGRETLKDEMHFLVSDSESALGCLEFIK